MDVVFVLSFYHHSLQDALINEDLCSWSLVCSRYGDPNSLEARGSLETVHALKSDERGMDFLFRV